MKRILFALTLLSAASLFADDGSINLIGKLKPQNGAFQGLVASSQTDNVTTNFNNNLSVADTDVQKALETLDNLTIGGGVYPATGTGSSFPFGISFSTIALNTIGELRIKSGIQNVLVISTTPTIGFLPFTTTGYVYGHQSQWKNVWVTSNVVVGSTESAGTASLTMQGSSVFKAVLTPSSLNMGVSGPGVGSINTGSLTTSLIDKQSGGASIAATGFNTLAFDGTTSAITFLESIAMYDTNSSITGLGNLTTSSITVSSQMTLGQVVRVSSTGVYAVYKATANNDGARGAIIVAAQAAAVNGETIQVGVGTFTITTSLGKNGVNWFFYPGAHVKSTTVSIWNDNATDMTFAIYGQGTFSSNGQPCVSLTGLGTDVILIGRKVFAEGSACGGVKMQSSAKLNIQMSESIISSDYDGIYTEGDNTVYFDTPLLQGNDGALALEGEAETVRGQAMRIVGGSLQAGSSALQFNSSDHDLIVKAGKIIAGANGLAISNFLEGTVEANEVIGRIVMGGSGGSSRETRLVGAKVDSTGALSISSSSIIVQGDCVLENVRLVSGASATNSIESTSDNVTVVGVLGMNKSPDADTIFAGGPVYVSATNVHTYTSTVAVVDDAYAASWNGSSYVPTKNAIYDKIESLVLGGSGDMILASTQIVSGTKFTTSTRTIFQPIGSLGTSSGTTLGGTAGGVIFDISKSTGWGVVIYNDQAQTVGSATSMFTLINTNPSYGGYFMRIFGNPNSNGEIRMDSVAPNIEYVETDQVGPAGKFEHGINFDEFYLAGRNQADDSFERLVGFGALRKTGGGYIALYSSPTIASELKFYNGANNATIGIKVSTGFTDAGSWWFTLPTTANNADQVLYQDTNGPDREWKFTTGGSSGDVLTKTSSSVTWTTPSAGGFAIYPTTSNPRIDGADPVLEVFETDQVAPAGFYTFGVGSDEAFISGKNAAGTYQRIATFGARRKNSGNPYITINASGTFRWEDGAGSSIGLKAPATLGGTWTHDLWTTTDNTGKVLTQSTSGSPRALFFTDNIGKAGAQISFASNVVMGAFPANATFYNNGPAVMSSATVNNLFYSPGKNVIGGILTNIDGTFAVTQVSATPGYAAFIVGNVANYTMAASTSGTAANLFYTNNDGRYEWVHHVNLSNIATGAIGMGMGLHGPDQRGFLQVIDSTNSIGTIVFQSAATTTSNINEFHAETLFGNGLYPGGTPTYSGQFDGNYLFYQKRDRDLFKVDSTGAIFTSTGVAGATYMKMSHSGATGLIQTSVGPVSQWAATGVYNLYNTGLTNAETITVTANNVIYDNTANHTTHGLTSSDTDVFSGSVTINGLLGISSGPVQSGIYTPVVTNVTNITQSTTAAAQYMRVGSVVTVSGLVSIDANASAGNLSEVGISLPFASNFTIKNDCAGKADAEGGGLAASGGQGIVKGDATNDRCQITWLSVDTAQREWWYTFTYNIK